MKRIYFNICCILLLPLLLSAQSEKQELFIKRFQTMSERWELERVHHRGLFNITPYKPVFVTAGRFSDNPNNRPVSENPLYSLPFRVNYNNYEAKFQFSLKTKVIYGMFKGRADLWVGYTQKAHWQIYNAELSRPFRELNYEPELILNIPMKASLAGFTLRMMGISFNHQSNGRSIPLSRSWNRVIAHAGFDRKNLMILIRGWYRLPDEEDENPAISDFTGRGESIVTYNWRKQQFTLILASALRLSEPGRGSAMFNWSFPVINNLRGQLQLGTGYGETLMDYNHRQSTVGLAVSLVDW